MSSRRCPDCLAPVAVCRALAGCQQAARRPAEPDYATCTDDELRQLGEFGRDHRVRAHAATALRARRKLGRPAEQTVLRPALAGLVV